MACLDSGTAGQKAPNYGNFQLETTFERIGTGMHEVDHTKEQNLFCNDYISGVVELLGKKIR
jgi:hypothetical protein